MLPALHIRGGHIVDPFHGRDEIGDVYIADGQIISSLPDTDNLEVIDATGLTVVPGLIDLHVHLREPGREDAETIASGSASAARGGFTTIVSMPNTTPAMDTPALISEAIKKAEQAGFVRLLPSACITKERAGKEVAPLQQLAAAGAVTFTDDGSTVLDDTLMREAMLDAVELGIPVMDHALDPIEEADGVMNAGPQADKLGLPGIPAQAEINMVARDIRLSAETNAAVHIQHISTRDGVELLRAARECGIRISGEVTPHHLFFCDEDVDGQDTDFKMSPPLCSKDDQDALIEAVLDGTIQAFATDHAPHTAESKAQGFIKAPCGVLGMETAVGATYTQLVKAGRMELADWVSHWTIGPAAVLGCSVPGLEPGQPADITLLDLQSEWKVDPDQFLSKSRNTPFKGRLLTGKAVLTICGGKISWRCRG